MSNKLSKSAGILSNPKFCFICLYRESKTPNHHISPVFTAPKSMGTSKSVHSSKALLLILSMNSGYQCTPILNSPTERVGFEPTDAFTSLDFKSSAFDHSATSPKKLPNLSRQPSIKYYNALSTLFALLDGVVYTKFLPKAHYTHPQPIPGKLGSPHQHPYAQWRKSAASPCHFGQF